MGSGFGTLCSRKKSESPAPEPPINDWPRPPTHGVGPREIARRENSRNLDDLLPRCLSGSACEGKSVRTRADFAQFSEMSDNRETGWWKRQSAANRSPRKSVQESKL